MTPFSEIMLLFSSRLAELSSCALFTSKHDSAHSVPISTPGPFWFQSTASPGEEPVAVEANGMEQWLAANHGLQ